MLVLFRAVFKVIRRFGTRSASKAAVFYTKGPCQKLRMARIGLIAKAVRSQGNDAS